MRETLVGVAEYPDELLTVKEVARILKLSVYAVRDYCKKGIIPAIRLGDASNFSRYTWRIRKSDLEAYISGRGQK